jgi:uncharacterized damage-inducible protein DinB
MKRLVAVFCLLVAGVATLHPKELKGFSAELLGHIEYLQGQILELENAIPDQKMTWRPNDQVRSISEVYAHIAFSNYLFAGFVGATPPKEISITSMEEVFKYEKASADKKAVEEKLVKSFDFVKDAIRKIPAERLDSMMNFFGRQITVRSCLLSYITHAHEHFGQSIAYARMVGVVPPWTAREEAAEKAKK